MNMLLGIFLLIHPHEKVLHQKKGEQEGRVGEDKGG